VKKEPGGHFFRIARRGGVNKKSHSSCFPRKGLSNTEPTEAIHQNYPFKSTLAIIITLKPTTADGSRPPRPFPQITGNILQSLAAVYRSRRFSCLHIDEYFIHIQASRHRNIRQLFPNISLEVLVVCVFVGRKEKVADFSGV